MKKIVWIFVGAVLAVAAISQVMAAPNPQAQSLGTHHQEITLTINPGEMTYLPIPKQNFPVRMEVTIPQFYSPEGDTSGAWGPFEVSFAVSDTQGGAYMNVPTHLDGFVSSLSSCSEHMSSFSASQLFSWSKTNPGCSSLVDAFVFGVAQSVTGNQNRVMLGIPNPGLDGNGQTYYGPVTIYVGLWY